MILITETPTVSIKLLVYKSIIRMISGNDNKKMISTGYYNDEIWMNVIFQIMVIIKYYMIII